MRVSTREGGNRENVGYVQGGKRRPECRLIRPHVQSSIWLKAQQFTRLLSCRGDNHMTSLELRLRGSNPDALLTYSDREQMGSYLQGQKMPTPLPSRPARPH